MLFVIVAHWSFLRTMLSSRVLCMAGAENARLENAELENPAPNRRGGKRGTGKRGNLKVMESRRCRKCAT